MAKNITVTFDDGSSHIYNNVPDNVTQDQVTERAAKEFSKPITHLDRTDASAQAPSQTSTNNGANSFNGRYGNHSPTNSLGITGGLGDLAAGAVRGAGSIVATLLTPYDLAVGNTNSIGNPERRLAIVDGLHSLGADPTSTMYKGGKLGAEIAGTADIGGIVGNAVSKFAPTLGSSIASGGLDLGANVGTNVLTNGANRIAGGAINGAATAGAVDPHNVGIGAVVGGALPIGVNAAGLAGNVLKGIQGNYSAANRASGIGEDLLANAGTNPFKTIDNLNSAQGNTLGFGPTTWQAAGNGDMAGFGRMMHGKVGGALDDRLIQQRQALADAIRNHASDDLGSLTDTDLTRQALVNARTNASEPFYDAAKNQPVALTPELQSLMQRPSMQQSLGRADTLVKEQGGVFNPDDLTGKTAQSIKFGMDDLINTAPQSGMGNNEINAIRDTKSAYLDQLGKQIPDYLKGNEAYAEMSKPINQLDLGNEVAKRFIPATQLQQSAPNELKYEMLARALRNNGDQLAQSVTGFKGSTLENTASEQQLKDYTNVLADTNYLKNADMGKMGGSPTYQNMKLDEKSNPIMDLAGQVPLKGVSMSTLKAIKDFVYKPANNAYKDELVQSLLNPKMAAQLMSNQMNKQEVPSAMIEALKNPAIRNALPLYLSQ